MNRYFPGLLLALALVMIAPAGCSADQPSATAEEAALAAEQATEQAAQTASEASEALADAATETVVDALPEEIPATNEELPEDSEIELAQAEIAPAKPEEQTQAARPAPFRVGDHYSMLTPTQPTSGTPGKVEVVEAFMYGCPHCFTFEPFIEKWLPTKASYIEFIRIPALFNRPARIHARAFYTAETLQILDQTHMPFFREIHVNRKSMTSDDELADFFANFGIDREKFRDTFNSFAVDTKLRRAEALNRRYRISSTPTVIINGKYITNGDKITGYAQYLEIADYLAAKEAGRE